MTGNATNNRVYLNRKITLLFIQLYKQHECLYNPSHDNYHNRLEKRRSLKSILQEIQKFVPELQLDNVRCKIKTIRTQFAHELTLIEAMELAGIPYAPRLWCFKHLTFLRKFMSRLPNKETGISIDDSDSNDGGKSFYRELSGDKLNSRPVVPRRTSFKWSRDTTEQYIKLHKKKRCLYDINHEDFGDREKRYEARQQLLDEMKINIPWITMQDIWLKHKCLRDQYIKELKVMVKAKANNITYVPKLWCFHQLSYLRPYNDNDGTLVKEIYPDSDVSDRNMEVSLDNGISNPSYKHNNIDNVEPHDEIREDGEDSNIDDAASHDDISKERDDSDIENAESYDDASEDSNLGDVTVHDDTDSNRDEEDSINEESSSHYGNDDANQNDVLSNHNNEDVEDEVEYDESVFKLENCSYVEILPLECEPSKNDMPDLKRRRSSDDYVKIEKIENKSTIETQNRKSSMKNKGTHHNDYEWLGNLVTSQLNEISPEYRTEFAWDIQCLARKYILKSKAKSKMSDNLKTSGHSSTNPNKNVILPRSTSLNISFI